MLKFSIVYQRFKQNSFQTTSPELKSCQPIQPKNKKSNVQDISNITFHNVRMTSLSMPFHHFRTIYPDCFLGVKTTGLILSKQIQSIFSYKDGWVALEFLTHVILGSLTVYTKRKSAYMTTYARNQSRVRTCSSSVRTYATYGNFEP